MLEGIEKDIFTRNALLLGNETLDKIQEAKVIIFGVGGVGSWCAEGLIRNGVKHLTIVDSDKVCHSNVNRQLQATTKTIGRIKVDVLKERLLEINPNAEITTIENVYSDENNDFFELEKYDYIIDAIDSLKDKIALLLNATKTPAKVYSAMGAALKVDPTKVKVAEFWDVKGCPLGSIIRKRMRQNKTFPSKKILCVYDEEVLENRGKDTLVQDIDDNTPKEMWSMKKAQINGSLIHITCIFGMTLAGLVIKDIYDQA